MSSRRFYTVTRDLHLYLGLFVSPFVLVFAVSVFFLVHTWLPGGSPPGASRKVDNLTVPAGIEGLNGREQVAAVRQVLNQLGVNGEIGFIRKVSKEHRMVIPVVFPGRETTVDLNVEMRSASIAQRSTGLADAVVYLHKMPGPHLANLRVNTPYMVAWRWLADATAYLMLFLTISGIYLWAVLRAERRIGLVLIAAGAFSFFGVVYALSH